MFERLHFLLQLGHSHRIARRYFVTNGFDGVLAILGLLMGFYLTEAPPPAVIISAALGIAVALFVSGFSSAYISESAERQRELTELEQSMLASMRDSAHGEAARVAPLVIALVNGLAPLLFSLIIIAPIWMQQKDLWLMGWPLESAIVIALLLIFLLGLFLGRISGHFWLWAGLRALLIAVSTAALILLLNQLIL